MQNIFHQSIEDILKTATPEQKILWNYIFLRWGERVSVSQYYYHGATSGELTVYSPNKIYLALQLIKGCDQSIPSTADRLTFYNESNAIYLYLNDTVMAWDATAAVMRTFTNSFCYKNILFSRIAEPMVTRQITFIGYRIGI